MYGTVLFPEKPMESTPGYNSAWLDLSYVSETAVYSGVLRILSMCAANHKSVPSRPILYQTPKILISVPRTLPLCGWTYPLCRNWLSIPGCIADVVYVCRKPRICPLQPDTRLPKASAPPARSCDTPLKFPLSTPGQAGQELPVCSSHTPCPSTDRKSVV